MSLFYVSKETSSSIIWTSRLSSFLTLDFSLVPQDPVDLYPLRWHFLPLTATFQEIFCYQTFQVIHHLCKFIKYCYTCNPLKKFENFVFPLFIAENPLSHAAVLGEIVAITWIRARTFWISTSFSSRKSSRFSECQYA